MFIQSNVGILLLAHSFYRRTSVQLGLKRSLAQGIITMSPLLKRIFVVLNDIKGVSLEELFIMFSRKMIKSFE